MIHRSLLLFAVLAATACARADDSPGANSHDASQDTAPLSPDGEALVDASPTDGGSDDATSSANADAGDAGPSDARSLSDSNSAGPNYCRNAGGGGTATGCASSWSQCDDGSYYRVECVKDETTTCTCMKDNQVTGTFQNPAYCTLARAQTPAARYGCGWTIEY